MWPIVFVQIVVDVRMLINLYIIYIYIYIYRNKAKYICVWLVIISQEKDVSILNQTQLAYRCYETIRTEFDRSERHFL